MVIWLIWLIWHFSGESIVVIMTVWKLAWRFVRLPEFLARLGIVHEFSLIEAFVFRCEKSADFLLDRKNAVFGKSIPVFLQFWHLYLCDIKSVSAFFVLLRLWALALEHIIIKRIFWVIAALPSLNLKNCELYCLFWLILSNFSWKGPILYADSWLNGLEIDLIWSTYCG